MIIAGSRKTILCDLQIYRKRERARGGGWVVRGGGVYAYHTPTHTHPLYAHTIIITIYNLMKISSICILTLSYGVVDVDF